METTLLIVTAMILTAPLMGYMQATAWAAGNGLVRKKTLDRAPAMNLD